MQLGSSPPETAPEGSPQRAPGLMDACSRHVVVDEVTVCRHGDEQQASRTTDANSSRDVQQQEHQQGGSALATALHAKHARLPLRPAQSQAQQMLLLGMPRRAVTRLDTDESLGDSSECGTVREGAMSRVARVQHLHGMGAARSALLPCSCMCLHTAHRLMSMPRPQAWACCQAPATCSACP